MKKQTFEKGDRVFHYLKGWGEIVHLYSDNWEEVDDNYTVCVVKFDSSEEIVHFTKYLATKTLSFNEYTLKGFNQERPPEYMECIGKWGKFWNNDSDSFQIGKLEDCRYLPVKGYRFLNNQRVFQNFKPLTDEQLKVLGL